MTNYPFNLLFQNVAPLAVSMTQHAPFFYALSDNHLNIISQDIWKNQCRLNADMFDSLKQNNCQWGVCGYLEQRTLLLADCPQMVSEQRFFHLGLDVILPLGTPLLAPLEGTVVEAYYEAGKGNYGGLVLLRHCVDDETFYSLYGHLNPQKLPAVGTQLACGEVFGFVGDFSENGDWFYHTHVQILTERAYQEGWISKGYCSEKDLSVIHEYCPNPCFLIFAGLK